jgi:hypothetical protein
MIQLLRLLCGALIGLLRSSARREAEILVLRHQINVLRRKSPNRHALSNVDRLLFVLLSQLVPSTLDALTVIKPATVIRWHRAGFRIYWRWKSRPYELCSARGIFATCSYQRYYNEARTHLSLSKDAPAPRVVQAVGSIIAKPHAVEKEYGPLPPNASQAALDERYRLAQAAKVIRLLEQVAISGKTKHRKPKQ